MLGHDVIAQADGSTVSRLLYDGGGSTRAIVDATGQIVTGQFFAYDAFGARIEDPANPIIPITNLLYRGEYWDATLGRYQQRGRYYNPNIGQFTSFDDFEASSSDPISLHKYNYANGDPVVWSATTRLLDVGLADVGIEVSLLLPTDELLQVRVEERRTLDGRHAD